MSTTRRSLLRRTTTLLALTVAAVLALFTAYEGVHGEAASLREDTAPAILDVTAAQNALVQADQIARNADDLVQSDLVNAGSGYRVQIAVANQSIARAAEASVRGESSLRALETVTGLIVSYTGWLEQADRAPDDSVLRDAYLYYANQTLTRDGDGILDRLDSLQGAQRDVLSRQASFGWPSRLAWAVALLLCATVVALLVETQLFLRRRFRRHFNLGLLIATVVLPGALAGLSVVTVQTQTALEASRHQLIHELVAPWPRSDDNQTVVDPERVSRSVRTSAEEVHTKMSGTERWDGLAGPVLVLGLVLAVLLAWGLWPRIDQYRFTAR